MTQQLTKSDPRDIQLGGLWLRATGVDVESVPSVEEFGAALQTIGRFAGASNWWIGDLANHADQWGDEYVQLLDSLQLEYKHIRLCAQVASGVPLSNRFDNLPWTHHYAVYGLTPPEQKKWLKKAQPREGESTPRLSVSELKAEIRGERIERDRKENPLPQGQYRVIYADPPWKYGDELIDGYGAAEHHYPTLSIEELCELRDASGKSVGDIAAEDAVLFLWATSPLLPDALSLIEAWGFIYKAQFVWDKVQHNYGHYNSVRHELLLIATRGSCLPDSKELLDSVVTVERDSIHSRKPECFVEYIDKMYVPNGTDRIELFARESRGGHWGAWGNEAKAKSAPPTSNTRIPVPEYDDEPDANETVHSYYSEFLELWNRADEAARARIRIFVIDGE